MSFLYLYTGNSYGTRIELLVDQFGNPVRTHKTFTHWKAQIIPPSGLLHFKAEMRYTDNQLGELLGMPPDELLGYLRGDQILDAGSSALIQFIRERQAELDKRNGFDKNVLAETRSAFLRRDCKRFLDSLWFTSMRGDRKAELAKVLKMRSANRGKATGEVPERHGWFYERSDAAHVCFGGLVDLADGVSAPMGFGRLRDSIYFDHLLLEQCTRNQMIGEFIRLGAIRPRIQDRFIAVDLSD